MYVKKTGTKNVAFYLKSEGCFFPKSTFTALLMAISGKNWLGHLLSVPISSDGPVSVVPREIALGPSEIFHRRRRLCVVVTTLLTKS